MRTVACLVAAGAASAASAGLMTLEAEGYVQDFAPSFGGAGQFPFAGLAENSPLVFDFRWDPGAANVVDFGWYVRYEFDGAGSTMTLGGSVVSADSLVITITGTPGGRGQGQIGFAIRNEALGFSGEAVFFSAMVQPVDVLPASLDAYLPTGFAVANSDANDLLVPVVQGLVTTARITPTPGAAGVLGVGGLLSARRRR